MSKRILNEFKGGLTIAFIAGEYHGLSREQIEEIIRKEMIRQDNEKAQAPKA